MKKKSMLAACLLFHFSLSASVATADIIDNFDNYATGNLNAVSGGTWRTWGGSSTDAQVVAEGTSVPNAITFGPSYEDVVTYNAGNLLAGGTAAFSADFYIKSGTAQMALSFTLGSGNSADNSINYNSLIANILVGGYGANDNEIHLWNPHTGAFPLLTEVTLDAWHNLSLVASQTGPSSVFDVYVDGIMRSDNYNFMSDLADINGFNALEIYTGYVGGTSNPASGSYLVDNISLTGSPVPIPGAVWLLGSGLAGLIGARKKKKA